MQFFNLKELQKHKNLPYLSLTSRTILSYMKCSKMLQEWFIRQDSQTEITVQTTSKNNEKR